MRKSNHAKKSNRSPIHRSAMAFHASGRKASKEPAEVELPQRDPGCVGSHRPNCSCTGELRGPIEIA